MIGLMIGVSPPLADFFKIHIYEQQFFIITQIFIQKLAPPCTPLAEPGWGSCPICSSQRAPMATTHMNSKTKALL